jgi:hypothetical protein
MRLALTPAQLVSTSAWNTQQRESNKCAAHADLWDANNECALSRGREPTRRPTGPVKWRTARISSASQSSGCSCKTGAHSDAA